MINTQFQSRVNPVNYKCDSHILQEKKQLFITKNIHRLFRNL